MDGGLNNGRMTEGEANSTCPSWSAALRNVKVITVTVGINSETGGTNWDQLTAKLQVHPECEQLGLDCVGGIQAKSPVHQSGTLRRSCGT